MLRSFALQLQMALSRGISARGRQLCHPTQSLHLLADCDDSNAAAWYVLMAVHGNCNRPVEPGGTTSALRSLDRRLGQQDTSCRPMHITAWGPVLTDMFRRWVRGREAAGVLSPLGHPQRVQLTKLRTAT